jgi:hypothetical protein
MASTSTHPDPGPSSDVFIPPYAPSLVDRMSDWIEHLPIAWWLFYVLLALAYCGSVALVLWRTGVYAAVGFHPMQVWLPTLSVYLLALTHALDRAAASAMQRFRPAFRGDDREFAIASYRITTLPARPLFIFTAIATIVSLPLGQWEMSQIQTGGLERIPILFLVVLACLYLSSYPFFFHVWYQLREIHRLHRDHAQVRLSAIRPMYALSRVTGLTAIGIVIFNYGWFLAQPGADPLNPVTVGETLFNLAVILVIFAWPLWGAHRLLTEAKDTVLAELSSRKAAARAQLRQALDSGTFEKVDPLHKALDAFQAELAELNKVPTWPWAAGTLRNLVGAVILPILLWLVQFGLGRLLR